MIYCYGGYGIVTLTISRVVWFGLVLIQQEKQNGLPVDLTVCK